MPKQTEFYSKVAVVMAAAMVVAVFTLSLGYSFAMSYKTSPTICNQEE